MIFKNSGRENTEETLKIAFQAAKEKQISTIIIASVKGTTVKKAMELNTKTNYNIVCVTHQIGFAEAGHDEMPSEMRSFLKDNGIKVLTTTHLFGGVDRAIRRQFEGLYPSEIIANTLRMFGQGTKVAVEISTMALDAGLIPYGERIIAIGGTARGADTALVLTPAHADFIFKTRIHEILCMPEK